MSISITDVRSSRRNAMQNIRRGFKATGEYFEQSPEMFPTGKGYSPSQLEALYDYYEQFRGHRITPDEMYDIGGFKLPLPDEDEILYDDFGYSDESVYYGSFIDQAKERIASTNSDFAITKFNDFIEMALDTCDSKDRYNAERILDRFFAESMDEVEYLASYIEYVLKSEAGKRKDSAVLRISKGFESFNASFFSWVKANL